MHCYERGLKLSVIRCPEHELLFHNSNFKISRYDYKSTDIFSGSLKEEYGIFQMTVKKALLSTPK